MKTVIAYEIIDHGVEHEQYFQGCGTAFTEFTDVYTGIGDTPKDALEDALESAAWDDWNVDGIENDLSDESDIPEPEDDEEDGLCELYHYVSLRLR